ncbi:MAG: hypothetical protein N2Z23_00565 [Pyrinomonadaceae bacterium]|nr:hypothetical protein [Pyrinomonadaceae bacterium]MCX7638926.1 hypothetical protein [Pyrinomonadaceae bacterium]MDW8304937.1 hypothetical protein [Acidobacteriota bacterium]
MKVFENKSDAEKKKIIVAIVLGVLALASLTYTFSGIFVSRKAKAITPPVTNISTSERKNQPNEDLPSQTDIESEWLTTPVVYSPSSFVAPEPRRNIFAFYEPPPPTPYQPTPTPTTEIPTPQQTPTPPLSITFINPQSVYAGTKGIRIEVNGSGFTPETYVFWNADQLPTTYISSQKLIADVPASFLAREGVRQIEVRSIDGRLYSLPVVFNVQSPPKPQFKYVGLIARRSYNNDTAYFQEGDKTPFGARLGDVVSGRFRLISISSKEVVFEDIELGFRHRLPLTESSLPSGSQQPVVPPGFPPNIVIAPPPVNPTVPPQPQEVIPGIPPNIPRYIPPGQRKKEEKSQDDDDDEDGTK